MIKCNNISTGTERSATALHKSIIAAKSSSQQLLKQKPQNKTPKPQLSKPIKSKQEKKKTQASKKRTFTFITTKPISVFSSHDSYSLFNRAP